jgi:hypothetical protein
MPLVHSYKLHSLLRFVIQFVHGGVTNGVLSLVFSKLAEVAQWLYTGLIIPRSGV